MDRINRVVRHLAPNTVAGSVGSTTDVVIVSGCRTAIGGFNGKLAGLSATQLGSTVIAEALKRGKVAPDEVGECLMGNVLSGNLGQAPARQAALGAGLPDSVPCTTVNKVCSSGMKSITLAVGQIQLGYSDCIVAGGMESMTNVPYYLPKARFGMKYGEGKVVDGLAWDGLTDAYAKTAMGNCAELCADEFKLSRKDQDDYAEESYKRAQQATAAGLFLPEIVPVVPKKGKAVTADEEAAKIDFVKMRKLRTVFKKNGTVTAANASAISDGAAAVVLMSAAVASKKGLKPLATILSCADSAQLPEKFTTAPALAIKLALKRANLTLEQVDLFEINEAFSVVALANQKLLNLDPAKVNVWGGAVSIGHPLGVSGCRIVVTLLHALKQRGGKIGVAAICNGGGGATAMVVQLC